MSFKIKSETFIDSVVLKEIVDTETGVCYLVSYKGRTRYDGSIVCTPMFDSKGNVKIDREFEKENRVNKVKENRVNISNIEVDIA